jgi:nicotinate dehydrogenase subunit B
VTEAIMNMHSRRDVLKGSGALIVSFSLAGHADAAPKQGATTATKQAAAAPAPKTVDVKDVDAYLAIDAKGKVTVYAGKVDLGTGVATALRQIAAEELDVALTAVDLVQGDTALTPDQGATLGSLSIQNGGMQIRQAAATARSALLDEAAKRLGVAKDVLGVHEGVVFVPKSGKRVTYAALIGGKSFALKLDDKAQPKKASDYKLVGNSVARVDIPDKMTGRFTYMQDFRLPGMLHARVVRPPAIGAKLQSVDESSVSDIPDLVKVVREGNFLAVVTKSEWGAVKAASKLKATWSTWEGLPEQAKLWDHVRSTKAVKDDVTSNTGNVGAAKAEVGANAISATYDFAIHTHGSIGPSCSVAEFKDGKLTSWSASQATHNLRKQLAQMLSLSPDNVRCIYVEGSGCYGRNGHEDAAADAALLAKVVGQPVRVQWSRADEHGWDPKGPPTLMDLRAVIDSSGTVTAWDSEFFVPQATGGLTVPLLTATLSGMPADTNMAPGNVFHNSAIPYRVASVKTVCHRLESTPFTPSWIRTPGRMQNTFANECFMDELAAVAGADPIEFRLKYLDPADTRASDVLHRVGLLAHWESRPSPQKDVSGNIVKGRGVTFCKYELLRTYIAAVAEVEVNKSTGAIRVTKFYVAHDCGQIINPDGVHNQIEGNVLQTLSRTLKEELKFDRSRVTSLDWESYPILRFPEMPEISVDLINRPNERPWGAGEPSAAVVPSAISNAVFDAAGVRLRSVPFTPNKVKQALSGSV